MKLVREKKKTSKLTLIKEYITIIEEYVTFAYLFCMLGIFPLYFKEGYYQIGKVKFEFFRNVSLLFLVIMFIFLLIKLMLQKNIQKTQEIKLTEKIFKFLDGLSYLDYAVFIYTICVILSYLFSDFKEFALWGAAGWEMGLYSQLIFAAVYFILSRQKLFEGFEVLKSKQGEYFLHAEQREPIVIILWVHMIVSAITFGLGILHRFEIDPLKMYIGLELYQKVEFLSTIGQATWYSSYVCTVFAIGIGLFYVSKEQWVRVVSGIYSIISFGILVTQNSDSAFIAIAGIIVLLGYYSLSDIKKWCRFWEIICLMWGTFAAVGVMQKIFASQAIPLDRLSIFFSQSIVTWVLLFVSLGIMFFYTGYKNRKEEQAVQMMHITKNIYKIFLLLLAAGVMLLIVFIYLNTKGYLQEWFGYQNMNQYLFFDSQWGNKRGMTWMLCWQSFLNLPWFQKLFGVGPDCLEAYLYSVGDIRDFLSNLLDGTRLTNAHNEYLNSLLCYGMVGVFSWLTVLIGGIGYFYQKAKKSPFVITFALCIMGYACHNIFCYQQVCCTPFLFIALGIGESLTKSEIFNTIK